MRRTKKLMLSLYQFLKRKISVKIRLMTSKTRPISFRGTS